MAYEVNGFAEAAMTSYQQAQMLSPDEPRWPYFQARMLARKGNLEAALTELSRVLILEPGHIPSLMWQGTWFLDLGRALQAESSFDRARTLGVGWSAEAGLARVLLRQGRANDAVALLEVLARESPFPSVYQLLGTAYRDTGAVDRARIALARGRNAENIAWLDPWEKLKQPYRISSAARLRKAQTLIRRGRIADAISLLEQLEDAEPGDPTVITTLSNAYLLDGSRQKGFWILRRALEKEPVHYMIHHNIAGFYEARGDTDTALHHFDRAIEINDNSSASYVRKARLLKRLGQMDAALLAFDLALERDAADPQHFIEAGDIHRAMARYRQAGDRYQQAISVDPSYLMGYLRLGNLHIQTNQPDEAQRILDKAGLLDDQSGQLDVAIRWLGRPR